VPETPGSLGADHTRTHSHAGDDLASAGAHAREAAKAAGKGANAAAYKNFIDRVSASGGVGRARLASTCPHACVVDQ
jgi:hypothetical protein